MSTTPRRRYTIPVAERPACAAWVTDYALRGGIAEPVALGLMAESGITSIRREPCGCAVVEGVFGEKEIVCEAHTPPRECPCGHVDKLTLQAAWLYRKSRGVVTDEIRANREERIAHRCPEPPAPDPATDDSIGCDDDLPSLTDEDIDAALAGFGQTPAKEEKAWFCTRCMWTRRLESTPTGCPKCGAPVTHEPPEPGSKGDPFRGF